MFGSSAASRQLLRVRRILIALQIALLVFSMAAPMGTIAAEPPPPSESPAESPSPDPTPPIRRRSDARADADPTPAPTPDATPEPTPDPTPDATPDPTPDPDRHARPDPCPRHRRLHRLLPLRASSAADQAAAIAAAGATDLDSIAVLRMHAVQASDGSRRRAARRPLGRVASSSTAAAPPRPPPMTRRYGDQWSLPQIGWDQVYGSVTPSGSAIVAVLDTGVDASHPDIDDSLVTGASFVAGSAWNDRRQRPRHRDGGHRRRRDRQRHRRRGRRLRRRQGHAGHRPRPRRARPRQRHHRRPRLGRRPRRRRRSSWPSRRPGYSSALQAAIDYAWANGVVLVAATGNDGSSAPTFPAGDRGVIGVSNTDQSDTLNASSNYGAVDVPCRPRDRDPDPRPGRRHHLRHRLVRVRGRRGGRGCAAARRRSVAVRGCGRRAPGPIRRRRGDRRGDRQRASQPGSSAGRHGDRPRSSLRARRRSGMGDRSLGRMWPRTVCPREVRTGNPTLAGTTVSYTWSTGNGRTKARSRSRNRLRPVVGTPTGSQTSGSDGTSNCGMVERPCSPCTLTGPGNNRSTR